MKGLVNCVFDKWMMLKVKNRKVWKYYGMEWWIVYDEKLYKYLLLMKYWCGMDGCWKVYSMEWFIKWVRLNFFFIYSLFEFVDYYYQGDLVFENKLYYISFVWIGFVS